MHLELHRVKETSHNTQGSLFVDGVLECVVLEDVVRDLGPTGAGKIPRETAIPAGTYEIRLLPSPKMGRIMPRLMTVPFFDGILIHCGNTEEDTWGCLLVGGSFTNDKITGGTSTPAYHNLFPKLMAAHCKEEKINIRVTNDFQTAV